MQVHSRHAGEAVTDLQLPHEYYAQLCIPESRDSAVGVVRLRAGQLRNHGLTACRGRLFISFQSI
jgi:hypothetical protein